MSAKNFKMLIEIAGKVDPSVDSAIGKVKTKLLALDKEFVAMDKVYNSITGGIKKTVSAVAKLAAAAAVPAAMMTKQMLDAGMSFEAQMSTVESISGATAQEMDKLSAKARYLGETTKFTATEVGQAMEYMGMAGWKSEQMLAGIEGVMNLAAASGEDLAMVSDMVTDNLTALGMTADESGRFVDVLAAAATNSNTNVALMKDTMKYAAPVAGALGFSIEDVAVALGVMANSGTKASIAGTALRNLFTNMANPTKAEAAAMAELGVSLDDGSGHVYSFMEIMQQLRKAFGSAPGEAEKALTDLAGLTDEQIQELESDFTEVERVQLSAQLAGKRGMSGLLAIVNATESDFNKLTDAIYNSEGAAERMAQIRLNNLTGDVTIFKSALEGLQIAVFNKVNPGLRELVQHGTEILGHLTRTLPDKIAKLVGDVNEAWPKLQKGYDRYVKPVIETAGGALKWLIDNGDTVIGVIAGIGGALAAYKVLSTVSHLVTGLLSLTPAGLAIMGVVGAVGLLVGHLAKLKIEEQKLIDQSLTDHWGDLTLSLEELDHISEEIVGKGNLQELRTVLDQYAQLDEISQSIDKTAESLDKLDWMVSLGVKLTDAENNQYKSEIDNYVSNVRDYIMQAWRAGASATQNGFNDAFSSNIATAWVNDYYSHQASEFERLGTELSGAMTAAFEDGFLDFDESKKIQEIRAKMTRIQAEIANSDFDKEIRFAEQSDLGNLTAESFSNLMETIVEKETEIRKAASDVYVDAMSEATAGYKYEREQLQYVLEHSKDGEELAKAANNLKMINQSFSELEGSAAAEELEKVGTAAEKALTFGTETLANKYSGDLQTLIGDYVGQFDEDYIAGIVGSIERGENVMLSSFNTMLANVIKDDAVAKGATELVKVLEPTAADVEALAKKYEEAGVKMPEGLVTGMNSYDMLKALSGDESAVYQQLLLYLSEEYPQYAETLEAAAKVGENEVAKIAESMEKTERLNAAAEKMANDTQGYITDHFGRTFYADVNLELQYEITEDLSTLAAAEEKIAMRAKSLGESAKGTTGKQPAKNAIGNIITSPTLSWVGEAGPEAIIPLNGTQRAQDLYNITGELMGMRGRFDGYSVSSGGTTTITYAPVINISGNADKDDVSAALNEGYMQFKRFQQQYERETARTAWGRS